MKRHQCWAGPLSDVTVPRLPRIQGILKHTESCHRKIQWLFFCGRGEGHTLISVHIRFSPDEKCTIREGDDAQAGTGTV